MEGDMPQERRGDAATDCDTSINSSLPQSGSSMDDVDIVDTQYSMQSVPEANSAQTSVTPTDCVPEIEIKLESSDEEEGGGVKLQSSCSKQSESVKAHLDSENSRRAPNDTHSPSIFRPARKRKVTSEVWQFFYRDATNICRAICSLCRMSVSRGKLGGNFGTTALKRHLESKHPIEWGQRKSMRLQRPDAVEEEEEETFEDEEEKEEQFEKITIQEASYDSPSTSSTHITMAKPLKAPNSLRTYEISDSSDEEGDKGRDEKDSLEYGEGSKRKRMMLAQDQCRETDSFSSYTIDSINPPLEPVAQQQHSSQFSFPDYHLIPPGSRKRKSTSAVWQFFYIDRTNICRAICTLCKTSVSRGKIGGHFGTSALMRHLEGKHPVEWGRGKINKPKSINVVEVEEDEDEEADYQLEQIYPQPVVPFLNFKSPCFPQYSDLSHNVPSSVPVVPLQYNTNDKEDVFKEIANNCATVTFASLQDEHMSSMRNDLNEDGKYTPNHPKAQSWNRNIAELMCGMGLSYSFIASKAFRKFMARADPRYCVPSKSFLSGKAIPQLYEAVCEKVVCELKRSENPHIHIATHMWSSDLTMDYLALTAHWAVLNADSQPSSKRKYAVLFIKRFPKDYTEGNIQQELFRQVNLWLSPNALNPGFFISGGDMNLVHAIKGANFTFIPCFAHSLNSLVVDFLQSNRHINNMLGLVRKVCSHFLHSARARRILSELQYQYNLPKHTLKLETVPHWTSTYYMLQRLLEQQKAVQEYLGTHKLETSDIVVTSVHWNLIASLVDLLQPFEMAAREVNSNDSSLSQVLPEVRYLHIFLKQIRSHFESKGDANGVVLADSFALKLSTDYGINEMFQREEYVLSTLLDPRFKGRIEAILPPGSDIDHWKQVLVKKVKEVMSSSCSLYSPSDICKMPNTTGQFMRDYDSESELQGFKNFDMEGMMSTGLQWRRSVTAPPLIQKEKSLIEHLENVGLLASKTTGASLSTESHSACVMVEKYLHDNKTIGAKDDPLVYWEKRKWLWPALTRLAFMYLTCPPSSISAERVFNSPRAYMNKHKFMDIMEGMEHIVFLKVNLENFPNYTPPPLIFSSDNETEQSDSDESF
ncbi:zinc finger BED domain-containing protein 6 [Bombina bombina]|uniref:zinc finger BED domain-containing protein 6 n=1 Tax=Bombina bombina TaxID=8345 RepID=UPI00235B2E29|nr:zinc finger BED domain-containing protein 6 [Bombina bombina]XP_053569642.1 zinc finger BED domain-containing protein 6 [Bombina bombina]XP_053569643.1 zinc finger BED domain-containing protein 6 [Bombina bombina]XP_053569644.1 zinc finger BED domain-containing protein 6 [Bombina bombina]XP_053569646.1 zinc finger BED domain-containing protein 6 [Bombina bombina]